MFKDFGPYTTLVILQDMDKKQVNEYKYYFLSLSATWVEPLLVFIIYSKERYFYGPLYFALWCSYIKELTFYNHFLLQISHKNYIISSYERTAMSLETKPLAALYPAPFFFIEYNRHEHTAPGDHWERSSILQPYKAYFLYGEGGITLPGV